MVDEQIEDAQLHEIVLRHKMEAAGIPQNFRGGFETFAALTPEYDAIRTRAMAYADEFEQAGKGLALIGPTGCGKTHLAAAIACRLLARRFSVTWRNSARLFLQIRSTFGRDGKNADTEAEIIDELIRPDLLVLDDLGVEKPAEWVLERLYCILNGRADAGDKAIIFTSNYNSRQLAERLAENGGDDLVTRLLSRLAALVDRFGDWPDRDLRRRSREA